MSFMWRQINCSHALLSDKQTLTSITLPSYGHHLGVKTICVNPLPKFLSSVTIVLGTTCTGFGPLELTIDERKCAASS